MRKPLFITITFLLIVAISFGLILPSFEKFKTLSFKVQQKEKELKELEDYLSHLQKISLQLKEFSPQLAKIDQALTADAYLPNLFVFLQGTSAENGARLDDIKISRTGSLKEKEYLQEREINLKLSGFYPNFKNFLSALEKSARLIGINNISFSTKSPKEIPHFDLTIKVYSY
ncbi:MAG: hypothetical protein COX34_02195 [Candidatus Nealsonbacteria bacterium CG23_combo_of_CG06-09_8_20_14_all_36_12]|uniref:Pilus assembly protein PilO n=2 Tax=Candidatus Nealsoniibacteriota TaxID=1817911 RepID=A0A2H0TLG8_9BACT|nr:MAG: hypothetical protein COX34_02195 [Candidatus Nealsonbacteria bacterium CG23_combo_of_CG06-09_8_20_14_all_36_12]PIR72993.1 MAG: hypothetical protein COV26_00850 [Candidatus Nealsonbacteria bacterium CG10_big_fil_rev_8_21_14_0_10_36_23]